MVENADRGSGIAVQVQHAVDPHSVVARGQRIRGGDDDGAPVAVEEGDAGDAKDGARAVGQHVVGRVQSRGRRHGFRKTDQDLIE